jgi:transporter family-2 protein
MNVNLAMALAAGAGVCIALQAAANSQLRRTLSQPPVDQSLWATYFSILGTLIFSSLTILALRPPVPSMTTVRATEWWNWTGGPFGALIVMSGTLLVPVLGVGKFVAFVVAGQLFASLIMDHYGLMGLKLESLTFGKILGAVLIVVGVVCIKFWDDLMLIRNNS